MIQDLATAKFTNLGELTDLCVAFYSDNEENLNLDTIQRRRLTLSGFIDRFHRDCGTLTPAVQKGINALREGNCAVVMSAHQPNLFPYSGVMRKTTLIYVLAKQLEERLRQPVVNFFGIADQDFTEDRWVKSSLLPAVLRRDGVLTVHVKLPEKLLLNKVAKPSIGFLSNWKGQIEQWLEDAISSVNKQCRMDGLPMLTPKKAILQGNFESFWSIVEDCYERAQSYSDLNAFVMSKIVNDVWGYDTLFSRFSECQQVFADEISFLLSRYSDYSRFLEEAHGILSQRRISSGVSMQESRLIPFWYHCGCGSKVRLYSSQRNGTLCGYGDCLGCDRHYELEFGPASNPDVSAIASRISLRAISWILAFSKGLGFCCYIGGVGGLWYLLEVRYVADKLGILLPPTPFWRPHDRYVGLEQMEALLELKRTCTNLGVRDLSEALDVLKSRIITVQESLDKLEASKKRIIKELRGCPKDRDLEDQIKRLSMRQTEVKKTSNLSVLYRDLKILENIPVVLDMIPSVIDYAVNVGLKETSDQWIQYLTENRSLSSDVHLETVLSQIVGSCVPDLSCIPMLSKYQFTCVRSENDF